jgi:hypothetical protein
MRGIKYILLIPVTAMLLLATPGCDNRSDAQKAMDKAADATKDAAKKTGDAAKDAGNKIKDATK